MLMGKNNWGTPSERPYKFKLGWSFRAKNVLGLILNLRIQNKLGRFGLSENKEMWKHVLACYKRGDKYTNYI